MTHGITQFGRRTEMAYVGDKPWHGLGNQLEAGQSIEAWQAAAGMDWKVLRSKVRYATERDQEGTAFREFPDQFVLMRSDNRNPLGIVSERYHVVHPLHVLEFFRDLTESLGYQLETAGTLFGGKRFWALAKTPLEASIGDTRDMVGSYLLLSTSADGSMATEARRTAIRVVCNNTLSLARGQKNKEKFKVSHKIRFDPAQAKEELGITESDDNDAFADAIEQFRRLAASAAKPAQVVEATAELFSPGFRDLDSDKQDKVLRSAPVQAVGALAMNGSAIGAGMAGTNGTAWGWLNAVTQYVDHSARARTVDNRLNSAWFGKGADLKERAHQMAMVMADGSMAYKDVPVAGGADILSSLLSKPVASK